MGKKRYLLIGDCFLNNELVEEGSVILWPEELKNNAMVLCDANGRPIGVREGEEVERVQRLDITPKPAEEDAKELTPEERADLIRLAVQDVLDRDDDADWTAKDEIRIEKIRSLAKIEDVSRDEIQTAVSSIKEDEGQAAGTEAAKARAAAKT